jgi:O-antigen ligase
MMLGLIVGLLVFILISILIRFKSSTNRLLLVMLALIIFTTIAYVYFEPLKQMALDFFAEEDINGGRQILWSSSISKIMDSPLIGYGPGAHASYFSSSFRDAHQTLLTVGLQAGILGIILYLVLNYKIFRKTYMDPYIVSSYTGIMLYALGGDILRRIPIWIFTVLFYYYSFNLRGEQNDI